VVGSRVPTPLFWRWAGGTFWFSFLLCLLAGFFPAIKASRMDVVNAVRFE
jgi:ABC-type lipoprotein release transport system permease subunit